MVKHDDSTLDIAACDWDARKHMHTHGVNLQSYTCIVSMSDTTSRWLNAIVRPVGSVHSCAFMRVYAYVNIYTCICKMFGYVCTQVFACDDVRGHE
jgi:hypothetical protein